MPIAVAGGLGWLEQTGLLDLLRLVPGFGPLESVGTGKGLRFRFENKKGSDILVRVMDRGSGNRKKPYYKISVTDKSSVDRQGDFTGINKNHIDNG